MVMWHIVRRVHKTSNNYQTDMFYACAKEVESAKSLKSQIMAANFGKPHASTNYLVWSIALYYVVCLN